MRTTTHHGWPVAQGTDPAKQYPAAVDGPFKDALDVSLKTVEDNWARLGIAGYRIEARSVVGTTDVSGALGVVFAKAFASAPVVIPSHADAAGAAKPIYMMSATAGGFFAGGQWAPSVPIRVNYIAIGPAVAATSREGSEPDPFITYIVDPEPS